MGVMVAMAAVPVIMGVAGTTVEVVAHLGLMGVEGVITAGAIVAGAMTAEHPAATRVAGMMAGAGVVALMVTAIVGVIVA